jgi:hypothetical protein
VFKWPIFASITPIDWVLHAVTLRYGAKGDHRVYTPSETSDLHDRKVVQSGLSVAFLRSSSLQEARGGAIGICKPSHEV